MNQQHMEALDRANTIRLARAKWKRDVRGMTRHQGACEVARMLRDLEPPEVVGMLAGDALTTIRRVGDTHARRLLADALPLATGAPHRRVTDLTERERELVAARLERVF